MSYLEEASVLNEEPNGFRKNRSCEDHIFSLYSLAKNRQEKGERTYVTFIDFSKAFDSVDRRMLLYNLMNSGVNGKMYFIVKALYQATEACVTLNGTNTDWFQTDVGVRQGDNLSPVLFSLYINQLANSIANLEIGIPVVGEKIC